VGILSEKDAIKVIHELDQAEDKTVSDYMTQPHIGFDLDESLLDVCDFLMKNIFRRVPITSQDRLVGVISIRDALQYVLQLRQARPDVD
jgi:CBS domain-containing protein